MTINLNTIDIVKEFVDICSKYHDCDIGVRQKKHIVNGKSILGIFSLNLVEPVDVVIYSKNENSKVCFHNKIQKWKVK